MTQTIQSSREPDATRFGRKGSHTEVRERLRQGMKAAMVSNLLADPSTTTRTRPL
jgi:hypothetical protein